MDNKELEYGHLLTMMGAIFGTKATDTDEHGNKIAKYNWDEFQQLAKHFYELGKSCKE